VAVTTIHLGTNSTSPLDLDALIETRLLVQANSGGGKSYTIRRLLEQTHGGVLQFVLDVEGDFGTLRERFDYALAGPDGDCPADPRTAGELALKLLDLGVSAIADISELQEPERDAFVAAFLGSLMGAPRRLWRPALVVVDEAHKSCPEGRVPGPHGGGPGGERVA
jgi:DNA helicase HerA-like ATPase